MKANRSSIFLATLTSGAAVLLLAVSSPLQAQTASTSAASIDGAGVVVLNGTTYIVRNGQATSLTSNPAPKGHMTLMDGTTAPIPNGVSGIQGGPAANEAAVPAGGARTSGVPTATPRADLPGVAMQDGVTYVIYNGKARPVDATAPVGYMTALDGSVVRVPATVVGLPQPAVVTPAPAPSATNPVEPSVNPRPVAPSPNTPANTNSSNNTNPATGNSGASRSGLR